MKIRDILSVGKFVAEESKVRRRSGIDLRACSEYPK